MSTKNKLYAIYSRKSTDDAENQKNSIEYQVTSSLDFAHRGNLSITPLTEDGFIENGVIREKHSAYKTSDLNISKDGTVQYNIERPKFQKLIKLLTEGKVDGVICLCWDRISRNEQDGMLIKELMKRGIEFHFVQTSYDKSSSGELHRDIDGMFAQHFSRVVSEKVRNTFDKFRSEGRCIGPASIGYLDQGSDSKPIDPIRGPIVIRIFEQYATGEWSMSQLAKWANNSGLTTKPCRPKRSRKEILAGVENDKPQVSRPVTAKTIENILKNPYYIGMHRNKKGKTWKCRHKALISQELFFKVQQVLKSKTKSIHYIDKPFFTFREVLRCSCGRTYSPYKKKGWKYYRCRCKEGCLNQTVNIKENRLHDSIEATLGKIILSERELAQIDANSDPYVARMDAEKEERKNDLMRERKKVENEICYLEDNKLSLLRAGVTSIEDYKTEKDKLESRLLDIDERIRQVGDSAEKMLNTVVRFSELIKMANLYYKNASDEDRRDIVDVAFTELHFANDKLDPKLKEGFLQAFSRYEQKKTHHDEHDVVSGSGGGVRTHDHLVNSEPLCH